MNKKNSKHLKAPYRKYETNPTCSPKQKYIIASNLQSFLTMHHMNAAPLKVLIAKNVKHIKISKYNLYHVSDIKKYIIEYYAQQRTLKPNGKFRLKGREYLSKWKGLHQLKYFE